MSSKETNPEKKGNPEPTARPGGRKESQQLDMASLISDLCRHPEKYGLARKPMRRVR